MLPENKQAAAGLNKHHLHPGVTHQGVRVQAEASTIRNNPAATHALKRSVQDMGKTVQRSMAALAAKQEQLQGLVSHISSLQEAAQVGPGL